MASGSERIARAPGAQRPQQQQQRGGKMHPQMKDKKWGILYMPSESLEPTGTKVRSEGVGLT